MQAEQPRFIADAHIPSAVVLGLRARGVDVVTAQDAALDHAPDERILEWALAERRTVLTIDADFVRLHRGGATHAGIVRISPSRSIGEIIARVVEFQEGASRQELTGRLEFL